MRIILKEVYIGILKMKHPVDNMLVFDFNWHDETHMEGIFYIEHNIDDSDNNLKKYLLKASDASVDGRNI